MWVQEASTELLLNLFQTSPVQLNANETADALGATSRSRAELVFIWRDEPTGRNQLPQIIVVRDRPLREFFAWTATYLGACRPLSAICRVMDFQEAKRHLQTRHLPIPSRLADAALGAMLGETATYTKIGSIRKFTTVAFAGTFSFAVTRSLANGTPFSGAVEAGEAWNRVRHLTAQNSLKVGCRDLCQVWRVLLEAFRSKVSQRSVSRSEAIPRVACAEMAECGEISTHTLEAIARRVHDKQLLLEEFTGPREERVVHLDHALRRLATKSRTTACDSFLAGYLTSRIAPGTFEHNELLLPFQDDLPLASIWYGICAGMSSKSKLRNMYSGLGHRILRDALRCENVVSSPRCDVSLPELEVLREFASDQFADISRLVVEVAPQVECVFRRQKEVRPVHPSAVQQRLFPVDADSELQDLWSKLNDSLASVESTRKQLSNLIILSPRGTRGQRKPY